MINRKTTGFTLLEILVALFIFTILSMLMMRGLQTVMDAMTETENKAARLRDLQMALLIFSRDIEQAVDRPRVSAGGGETPAMIGLPTEMYFVHTGHADAVGNTATCSLQAVSYVLKENQLLRHTWPVLDQVVDISPATRVLLSSVEGLKFEYMDKQGLFHSEWPAAEREGSASPLPAGVRIQMTLQNWGRFSQFWIVPAGMS